MYPTLGVHVVSRPKESLERSEKKIDTKFLRSSGFILKQFRSDTKYIYIYIYMYRFKF